jgi:uncharacterized protein YigE (DUF2233 family)
MMGQYPRYVTYEFASKSYDTYTVDLKRDSLVFFWKDQHDSVIGGINSLIAYNERQGFDLDFAMNGGIFMENGTPLGLYIENGKELVPLNRKTSGYGNFYLQPNGVFYLTGQKAGIVETSRYIETNDITYATQSGPLLVMDGSINGLFSKNSQSLYIRNGVGLIDDQTVIFVISNEPVSLYDLASFFKDKVKCNYALYLDGAISGMYIKTYRESDIYYQYGCMIGLVSKRLKIPSRTINQ